jgi:hypothetical protein
MSSDVRLPRNLRIAASGGATAAFATIVSAATAPPDPLTLTGTSESGFLWGAGILGIALIVAALAFAWRLTGARQRHDALEAEVARARASCSASASSPSA